MNKTVTNNSPIILQPWTLEHVSLGVTREQPVLFNTESAGMTDWQNITTLPKLFFLAKKNSSEEKE